MSTIRFVVSIKKGNQEIPITIRSRIQPRIIEWYKVQYEFLAEFYSIEIVSISFNYDEGYFTVKYQTTENTDELKEVIEESLVDPDDDGNNPIQAYGTNCLVIGTIF
jgi:hypothetical protein